MSVLDSSSSKKLSHLDWTPGESRFQFLTKTGSPGLQAGDSSFRKTGSLVTTWHQLLSTQCSVTQREILQELSRKPKNTKKPKKDSKGTKKTKKPKIGNPHPDTLAPWCVVSRNFGFVFVFLVPFQSLFGFFFGFFGFPVGFA